MAREHCDGYRVPPEIAPALRPRSAERSGEGDARDVVVAQTHYRGFERGDRFRRPEKYRVRGLEDFGGNARFLFQHVNEIRGRAFGIAKHAESLTDEERILV